MHVRMEPSGLYANVRLLVWGDGVFEISNDFLFQPLGDLVVD